MKSRGARVVANLSPIALCAPILQIRLALEKVITIRINTATAWAFGGVGGVKDWETELAFDVAGEDPWG